HAKVQREIGEHDETSCEAEPPDRHLIAEKVGIYHLTPSPGRDAHRTNRYQYFGRGENVSLDDRFGSNSTELRKTTRPFMSAVPPIPAPTPSLTKCGTGPFPTEAAKEKPRPKRGQSPPRGNLTE